ncbi:MAG: hypothetical protein J0M24_22365 [Verrucomicrobia bacterium]|nr:hypothetical protein [Verrucomicrobiota bacterium]
MKFVRSLSRSALLLSGTLTSCSLWAQESPYDLEKAGWFIRTGAYLQTGMSMSVNRVVAPTPITPGLYDNGFVQPDISQGAGGLTWNWGYTDNSQIVGDQLEFSRVEGLATVNSLENFENPTLFGPEILVGFEFYTFEIKNRTARFGFEIGARFGNYSGSDRSSVSSDVALKRDRYSLGGIVPPEAPYFGLPDVPGPLISLTPIPQNTRFSRAHSGLATEFEADFYTARFGAWLNVPLSEKWTVGASLGFTSIYAYGTATFTQVTTYDNPLFVPVTQTARQSEGDWLPGAYLQFRGEYRILDWMSAYLSAECANNGALRINGLDYQAKFDFGFTYGASGGLLFSF